MAAPAIPASVLQRVRDGAPIVVVVPGLAGPPWRAPVDELVRELAGTYGVELIGDGGAEANGRADGGINDGGAGDGGAAERAAVAWLVALREACRARQIQPMAVIAFGDLDGDEGPEGHGGHGESSGSIEGWIARLGGDDDAAAREALGAIEQTARAAGDWARVIEVMMGRIEHAGDGAERARLLREVAEIYEADLGDLRRAFAAIVTACHMAPEDDGAAGVAARLASVTGSWSELVREASRLASEAAAGGEPALAARWWTRVGGWYATRIGDLEAAMQAYESAVAADGGAIAALEALVELYGETGSTDEHRQAMARLAVAVERDPDNVHAALGFAAALVADAESQGQTTTGSGGAIWREVDRRYREILARHRAVLSGGQITEIWARLGSVARTLGDARGADAAFRRVIEREPLHEAARQALIELAGARGDWRAVNELRREELDALAGVPDSAARRAKLAEQIGDVAHDRLADPGAAITAYEHAVALAPSRGVLHKLLEVFTAQRTWRRAIEALERLAAEEAAPDRRARFHFAAAVIARDELDDGALTVDKLTAALDDAPLTAGAFDALDDLLTARGDWKQLARAFRHQLKRLADADPAVQLELWLRLGEVCVERLADHETAIAAYQVACELAPGDLGHRERLVELYLAAGAPRRRDAIGAVHAMLAAAPDRIELYKALAGLYLAEGALDKAWCMAQVLVVLGAASDDEARLFARYRPHGLPPAPHRLTDEHWQLIAHPAEDRRIGALFAAAGGAIALGTARPITAFGLDPEARVDLGHDARPASRLLHYVTCVLAIEPAPVVWFDDGDGLRIANTLAIGLAADRPRLGPALLAGAAILGTVLPSELAFAAGKRLAYLRSERFVAVAVATLPKLEVAFAAARLAAVPAEDPDAASAPDEVRALAAQLRAGLPGPVLDQLAEVSAALDRAGAGSGAGPGAGSGNGPGAGSGNGPGAATVAAWRAATDLTANRAGLVIANDLDAAVRAIATEGTTFSGLPVKDRIRDLLGFAASERYFAVRRHLGQHIHDEEVVARPGEP
ncbi:MAG TPA: hypothetical protein VH165_04525 [Kofleriaceae bacterium]|nr:hypothetical protein [Kofleriaceae bacterium]